MTAAAVLAQADPGGDWQTYWTLGVAAFIFVAVAVVVFFWWGTVRRLVARQEAYYERVLRGNLLMEVKPRTVTFLGLGLVLLGAIVCYSIVAHPLMALLGAGLGAGLPPLIIRFLRRRRLYKLEEQLVDGIQTLTSAVRAGLNLIQAMKLLAGNAVRPISEEFSHLTSEYDHGVSLEQAMQSAARRIGSSNYRLLFSALLTHRERGGNLGETLERIAESIREIHRLEKRVETLTSPGRIAARWMGMMPAVVMLIMYAIIDRDGIEMLFTTDIGKSILFLIVVLNVVGFLWIRKIVNIDI